LTGSKYTWVRMHWRKCTTYIPISALIMNRSVLKSLTPMYDDL